MFGGPGLYILGGIAYFLFGPKRIPELAKTLGQAMQEYKKLSDEVKGSFAEEISELRGIQNSPGVSRLSGLRRNTFGKMGLLADLAEKAVPCPTCKKLETPPMVQSEVSPGDTRENISLLDRQGRDSSQK